MEAYSRTYLDDRSSESLKDSYICVLQFETYMEYGKKSLKKLAVLTSLLPTKDSVHTQTETKVKILNNLIFDLRDKRRILKRKTAQTRYVLVGPSSQIAEDTDTIKDFGIDNSTYTLARLVKNMDIRNGETASTVRI